jgi:hypothetical protein
MRSIPDLSADEVIEERDCFAAVAHSRFRHQADMAMTPGNVRFSNRPFRVKRFQTIHH